MVLEIKAWEFLFMSLLNEITNLIQSSNSNREQRRNLLREIVGINWGQLPTWSTLDYPEIEVVQKATVGSGAVFVYRSVDSAGVYTDHVLLAEAGPHYKKEGPLYMIPGGFMNLSRTPGSSLVDASDNPESPRNALARECEEELKNADGSPLFKINPNRFIPMDMNTIRLPWGETRVVLGSIYVMKKYEFEHAKAHVAKLQSDDDYRDAVATQTINPDSGLPEVASLAIVDLDDIVKGGVRLLHADQLSLFDALHNYKPAFLL